MLFVSVLKKFNKHIVADMFSFRNLSDGQMHYKI